ncbi:hypothetical protein [Streptococcus oriscaviae]|uniref:SMI1/KNR4 family protein n=1 Tax=Streptococcus oriscaviae TaxID=2781599 RepID=A0ABX7YLP1_9STRE|nr:hypothetical protein [Streptococcus oriscaviae]QUE54730.1 hypothetical protein INT76_02255 [Streptococcus oriscaviae]
MEIKNILPDLVECFYLSNRIDGEIEFLENPLLLTVNNISGQLLEYYQHLSFAEDCYFGNQFFDIVLLPIQSEGTRPETFGVHHDERFQKNDYIIFAHTTSDDVIFCDVRDEKCPVYGLISGGEYPHKLGDSLYDFLSFYIKIVKLEINDYHEEIYSDNNFNIKKEFVADVSNIINNNFSGESHEGLITFLLSGL